MGPIDSRFNLFACYYPYMPRTTSSDSEEIGVVHLRFTADALQIHLSEAEYLSNIKPEERTIAILTLDEDRRTQIVLEHLSRAAAALTRNPGQSDVRIRALASLHDSLQKGLAKLKAETHLSEEEVLHSFFDGRPPFREEIHVCTDNSNIHDTARHVFGNFEEMYQELPDGLQRKCSHIASAHPDTTPEELVLEAVHAFVYVGPIEEGHEDETITEGIAYLKRTLKNLRPHFNL